MCFDLGGSTFNLHFLSKDKSTKIDSYADTFPIEILCVNIMNVHFIGKLTSQTKEVNLSTIQIYIVQSTHHALITIDDSIGFFPLKISPANVMNFQ